MNENSNLLSSKPEETLDGLIVQNTESHSECPFCGGKRIYSAGEINYPNPIIFADTKIILARDAELWKCKNCESGFVQNSVLEEDAAEFYSNEKTGRWSSAQSFMSRRTSQVVDAIRAQIKPGMRVLDIGCSNGTFLDFASELGCETYGVEFSEEAIAVASAKGHICCQAIDDLDQTLLFDAVFCFDVIEHVYDVEGLIKRLAKLVKSSGLLFILIGDIQCTNANKHGSSWWYVHYPEHIRFPSVEYFSTMQDFELLAVHKTYALQWQDGKLKWKLRNIIEKKLNKEYYGMPSLSPDHMLVVLRKKMA